MTSFIRRRARWQAGAVSRRRAALRALLALAALLVVLGVIAQLVLPPLAVEEVRDKLGPYGSVQSVSIGAFPALTLLWGDAGSLTVRAGRLALTPSQSAALLAEASGIERLDATIGSLREGPLQLRSARVHKRGSSIRAEGQLGAAPPGIALLSSAGGAVRVSVGGSLFGLGGRLEALVRCLRGRLVAEVPGLPLRPLTLFADRHLYLTAVGFAPQAGGGYKLWLAARVD
jgi:hypothetical protein